MTDIDQGIYRSGAETQRKSGTLLGYALLTQATGSFLKWRGTSGMWQGLKTSTLQLAFKALVGWVRRFLP